MYFAIFHVFLILSLKYLKTFFYYFRAISVILGEAWRNLPPAEKEGYVIEAKAMAQERKRLHPDCWKRKRSHSTSLIDNSPT